MNSLRGWIGSLVTVAAAVAFAGCAQTAGTTDAGDAAVVDTVLAMDRTAPPDAVSIDAPVRDAGGTDAAMASDTYINIFEIFPLPEGGVAGECASCAAVRCGMQVN